MSTTFTAPPSVSLHNVAPLVEKYWRYAIPASAIGVLLYQLVSAGYETWRQNHSTNNLPGPAKDHWFWGNLTQVIATTPHAVGTGWLDTYGATCRFNTAGGKTAVLTADLHAINHMLARPDLFVKPAGARLILGEALGKGLITVQGPDHRRQRRVLNPAFGWRQILDMAPMIFDKAEEMRDMLNTKLSEPDLESNAIDRVPGSRCIDMSRVSMNVTLDIIGRAGFGYEFNALKDGYNVLREAYMGAIKSAFDLNPITMFQIIFPAAGIIPTARKRDLDACRATAQRIGRTLVEEKKRNLVDVYAGIEKNTPVDKDALSLMLKANMAPDLGPEERLTDEDVMEQLSTILFAGHETTGTSMMWGLYHLAKKQWAQDKLRAEVLSVGVDRPSFEVLNELPYLDAVVHEILRLENPAPVLSREASADTILPLGQPIMGRDGTMLDSVHIKAGQLINLPTGYVNQWPEVWGEDAREFNPDRHLRKDLPRAKVPGVWGNILTFIGGPRNCIGHRLSVLELKVLFYVLASNFKFEELPSKPEFKRTWMIIERCMVVGEEDVGPQLPLLVTPVVV